MFKRFFFISINRKKVFFFSVVGFVLAIILGFESSCTFFRYLADKSPAAAKPVLTAVRVRSMSGTDLRWKPKEPNENGSYAILPLEKYEGVIIEFHTRRLNGISVDIDGIKIDENVNPSPSRLEEIKKKGHAYYFTKYTKIEPEKWHRKIKVVPQPTKKDAREGFEIGIQSISRNPLFTGIDKRSERLVLKFVYRCPSVSVAANPGTIKQGEITKLTWEWEFAERLIFYANDEVSERKVSLTEKDSFEGKDRPRIRTTYKIEAYGAENCLASAQTTVEVIVPEEPPDEEPPDDVPEQPEFGEKTVSVILKRNTPYSGNVQYLGRISPVKTGVVKSITNPSKVLGTGIIIYLADPKNCSEVCIKLDPQDTTDKCYGDLPLYNGLTICAFAGTISGSSFPGDVVIKVTYTYEIK
ncbi:MAG: hypothetical protein PVH61_23080 [Candidatus Aminicenantes bacterium]|jgi:hypothetical protein